jgi:hypothetical protein
MSFGGVGNAIGGLAAGAVPAYLQAEQLRNQRRSIRSDEANNLALQGLKRQQLDIEAEAQRAKARENSLGVIGKSIDAFRDYALNPNNFADPAQKAEALSQFQRYQDAYFRYSRGDDNALSELSGILPSAGQGAGPEQGPSVIFDSLAGAGGDLPPVSGALAGDPARFGVGRYLRGGFGVDTGQQAGTGYAVSGGMGEPDAISALGAVIGGAAPPRRLPQSPLAAPSAFQTATVAQLEADTKQSLGAARKSNVDADAGEFKLGVDRETRPFLVQQPGAELDKTRAGTALAQAQTEAAQVGAERDRAFLPFDLARKGLENEGLDADNIFKSARAGLAPELAGAELRGANARASLDEASGALIRGTTPAKIEGEKARTKGLQAQADLDRARAETERQLRPVREASMRADANYKSALAAAQRFELRQDNANANLLKQQLQGQIAYTRTLTESINSGILPPNLKAETELLEKEMAAAANGNPALVGSILRRMQPRQIEVVAKTTIAMELRRQGFNTADAGAVLDLIQQVPDVAQAQARIRDAGIQRGMPRPEIERQVKALTAAYKTWNEAQKKTKGLNDAEAERRKAAIGE